MPENFTLNSGKKVWWKCSKGHEWQAPINNRSKGIGCPYCANQKVLPGYNDLGTLNPSLAQEWHPTLNRALKPSEVTLNTHTKIWWKCSKGHEWESAIANRSRGTGCPYCSNKKILKGYNDLATINPKLSEEWNDEKNNGLTTMDVALNSNKKVWWKCSKGHEWQAVIAQRSVGSGCPYCSGHKALKGYNDLGTINPNLANEWNYDKNGDVTPENFTANSGKNAWWKCPSGHEWKARIINRNKGIGCPYCSGRIAIHGENDLQTVNPILAAEWDYESNDGLTPIDVLPKSDKKVWWKCQYGHKWQSAIKNRSNGCGCPVCTKTKH